MHKSVIILNAMPEPSPAKTKMSMEMNSANAALRVSGWPASTGDPTAILGIAILDTDTSAVNEISLKLSLQRLVALLLAFCGAQDIAL